MGLEYEFECIECGGGTNQHVCKTCLGEYHGLQKEVERLRSAYRDARQMWLAWETADKFDYKEQDRSECEKFVEDFNAETERVIAKAAGGE